MKRIGWFLAVLLVVLMGCGDSGAGLTEGLSGAFSYDVEGQLGGVSVCGRVFADAPQEDEHGRLRRVGIIFSAPDALCGMTVVCDGFNPDTHELGNVTVTLDGMTVDDAALDGLLTPALLLAAELEQVSVTADKKGETTVVSQANGNRRTLTFCDGVLTGFEGQFHGTRGVWRVLP